MNPSYWTKQLHGRRVLVEECSYPFVDIQTGCQTPFSEVLGTRYLLVKVLALIIGGFLTLVCAVKLLLMAKKADGTRPQWIIFPFLVGASFCLFLQGLDPLGLSGQVDILVFMLAHACSTCLILSAAFYVILLAAVAFRNAKPPSKRVSALTSPVAVMGMLGLLWVAVIVPAIYYGLDVRGSQFTVRLLETAMMTVLGATTSMYCLYLGCTYPSKREIILRPSSSAVLRTTKASARGSNLEERTKNGVWNINIWRWWQGRCRTSKFMVAYGLIGTLLTALLILSLCTLVLEGEYESSWQSYQDCLQSQAESADDCSGSVDNALVLAIEAVLLLAFIVSFWVDRGFGGDELSEKLQGAGSLHARRADSTGWFTSSSASVDSDEEDEPLEGSPAVSTSEIFSSRGSYEYDGKAFDDLMPPDDGEKGGSSQSGAKYYLRNVSPSPARAFQPELYQV